MLVGCCVTGATGLYAAAGLAGALFCLASFFGFFFSRPRVSRLPMRCSPSCLNRNFPASSDSICLRVSHASSVSILAFPFWHLHAARGLRTFSIHPGWDAKHSFERLVKSAFG